MHSGWTEAKTNSCVLDWSKTRSNLFDKNYHRCRRKKDERYSKRVFVCGSRVIPMTSSLINSVTSTSFPPPCLFSTSSTGLTRQRTYEALDGELVEKEIEREKQARNKDRQKEGKKGRGYLTRIFPCSSMSLL